MLRPTLVEGPHLPEVRPTKAAAKLFRELNGELFDQSLAIASADLTLLLKLHNPPANLPVNHRHQSLPFGLQDCGLL